MFKMYCIILNGNGWKETNFIEEHFVGKQMREW